MSDATLQDLLSNYRDTFSPTCDNPMSAAQLADTMCHAINGSGVDLKKVLSILQALYDTVGDMVHDLETQGRVSQDDVELEEAMEEVDNVIVSDAWVLRDREGLPLDVFLKDSFPEESDVWKEASRRRPVYPSWTVAPADLYFRLSIL